MRKDYPKLSVDATHFKINKKTLLGRKIFIEALKFHKPGIAPVCDKTGWYHINTKGKSLYSERYKRTFGFYCNRASVIDFEDKWFHISTQGKRVYSQSYAWTGNFQENICTVRDFNNNYFHIDKNGDKIYIEKYNYAGDFKDGFAVVRLLNGFCKHIDKKGEDLNGKLFDDLGVFHKQYAVAKDKKGWFHIDKQGNQIYKQRYAQIEPFYNGFALVDTLDNKKIIIDEKGKIIIKIF